MEIIISPQQKKAATARKITVVLSLFVLLISFTQPALFIESADSGLWAQPALLFFFGFIGALGGVLEVVFWLANPIYIVSVYLLLKERDESIVFSAIATLIALAFSMLKTVTENESGSRIKIASLQWGYKLWVLSLAILFIGTIVNAVILNKKQVL